MKKYILTVGLLTFGFMPLAGAQSYSGGALSDRDGPDFTQNAQTAAPEQQAGKKAATGQTTALPITLYGDNLVYHKDTGYFSADGQVRILQGEQVLHTTKVEGNMQTGDVYLLEGGQVEEPNSSITGEWVHYNFNNKSGEFRRMSGYKDRDIFKAEHGATDEAGNIILDKGGQFTRCPAVEHDPCLLITADRIEIYPGEKLVAKDVKVFLKGKHIYSKALYVTRLDGTGQQTFMPHIGYNNDDGFRIKMHYEHNFNQKLAAVGDFNYYEKDGYKPMYGLRYDEKAFFVKVQQGWDEDSDDNWLKKKRDVTVGLKEQHIAAGLPVRYSAYYNRGTWEEEGRSSRHTEYGIYFTHDRIFLDSSRSLFLDLGIGAKRIKESYNNSTTETMMYKAGLGKKFNEKWSTWMNYYSEQDKNQVFNYNTPDMENELQNGVTYTFDKNNSLTFINRYDLDNQAVYEQTWRYRHDFCCWALEIEYRDKKEGHDRSWHIKYDLVRW